MGVGCVGLSPICMGTSLVWFKKHPSMHLMLIKGMARASRESIDKGLGPK